MTALHYAVEKQDHDMYHSLMHSEFIDIFKLDEEFLRPIQNTVIFSAFHKILYKREKLRALKLFNQDLLSNYIAFNSV